MKNSHRKKETSNSVEINKDLNRKLTGKNINDNNHTQYTENHQQSGNN